MPNWSPQQQAIFSWFKSGAGNLVVRARAGTGKTTTILEAINYAPERQILLCAFNKRIADELVTKLRNQNAEAKTLHSVGFKFIRDNWKGVQVDDERKFRLARRAWAEAMKARGDGRSFNALEDAAPDPVIGAIAKLAALGKNAAPFGEVDDLEELALRFNVLPENGFADEVPSSDLAAWAFSAMHFATERDGTIDFDDMIYLPVVHKWARPSYDLVIVDEAQDMNQAQLLLALRISKGRIAVVGDDRQAIYGFRGADSNAIDRLKQELKAVEMPLTITYRCPKSVVAIANALVPDYMAADTAPEGVVRKAFEKDMMAEVSPGDFILSRLNAPLGRICLTLLRQGKKVRIEGRDIGKGLISLVKRMRAQSIPDLHAKLERWQDREISKLSASKKQAAQTRIDYIRDQVDTIDALSDGLAEVEELITRIEGLFSESQGPAIVCSTVHKAKGLEAPKVFVLTGTLYCNGKRLGEPEEANIHYVAVTRAKQVLVLVVKEG
jgi:DNA helicase-2/ATP-dependent DNA helicase PcrA